MTSNPEFKNFEKVELMSLVSIENTKFLTDKDDLNNLHITYLQAVEIVGDIIRIHLEGSENYFNDERPIKAFVDQLYWNESGIIDWFNLMKYLKK